MYDAVRTLRERDVRAAHRLWRERRDELFRAHPQSALLQSERAAFRGLPYRDYDPAFSTEDPATLIVRPRLGGAHALERPVRDQG